MGNPKTVPGEEAARAVKLQKNGAPCPHLAFGPSLKAAHLQDACQQHRIGTGSGDTEITTDHQELTLLLVH